MLNGGYGEHCSEKSENTSSIKTAFDERNREKLSEIIVEYWRDFLNEKHDVQSTFNNINRCYKNKERLGDINKMFEEMLFK